MNSSVSVRCWKNAKTWVLSLKMGSLKSEGEVKMSSDRGARRICSLNLPSKAGQEVFKWVEVTVRGVLNCQDRARKRGRQKGNSKVIGSFGVREIEPRPHICWARSLLLSYTLSPHFLFWARVSLSHPGLEFLILLPPPSKQLRWQAGLCNRNHTSWFKKNNTLLYPKQHLKIRKMKECKWEWGLHCIWNNAVIRGLWGVICVY